jgi:LPS-assembly protein
MNGSKKINFAVVADLSYVFGIKKILKYAAFFFVFCFFCGEVFGYDIDINADRLEYDEFCGKIRAQGNVVLIWEGRTVHADYVEFETEKKIIKVFGNAKIEENKQAIFAKEILYNYEEKMGDIKEVFGNSSIAFIRSPLLKGEGKDIYRIKGAIVSNCDLDEPHVFFKAKKGKLTVGKRITLYNALLYIGKVPVFYLPFFTKSLDGKKVFKGFNLELAPGYSNGGGFTMESAITYVFNDNFRTKVNYDYLGKKGSGYGTEINYNSSNIMGSLYAYNIKDLEAGRERWTVRPSYWQRIGSMWTIRSQGEFMSDNTFNNSYNLSNWERVTNTLYSFASVARQDQYGNLTATFQRYDDYDSTRQKYYLRSQSLPAINYTFYPKKIFFDISNNFDIKFDRSYQRYAGDFYEHTANLTYSLSKDFKFGRRLTLKPTIGITERWDDKDNIGKDENSFFTYYSGSLNSRFRAFSWMDWNANHNINFRSIKNDFDIDKNTYDYGIENNATTLSNYMYLGDRTTVKNSISYNWQQFRTNNMDESARWSPLMTEIIWTPKYYITAYIKQTQLVKPSLFETFQLDLQIGELEKIYFNFGAFYKSYRNVSSYSTIVNGMENLFGVGIWVTPKWRFDYNIRTKTNAKFDFTKMTEHELRLYRDLHCYNLGFRWIIRDEDYSFHFKFDLKTNMPFDRERKTGFDDAQNVFYPWR